MNDYFSTFLKRANVAWDEQAPSSVEEPPAPAESSAVATESEAPSSATATVERPPATEPTDLRMGLVAYLAENGPAPIADVQAKFNLGITEVGPLFGKLEAAGLIRVTGDPGVEVVELTQQGAVLA